MNNSDLKLQETESVKEIAISLKHASKKYPLYESPGHRLQEAFWRGKKRFHKEFWALRDINLEIPAGVTLGVMGQNGSGKSTLLQIIGGIMEPSRGEVHTSGRISAILELGAGFNPDFTGRENALLSGLILGLTPREMKERLGAVIEFAEIGEFIDQPVKTYSSGMYVRLAFAVAINLEPDILLVDEVLAVGDIYFQHKCTRKIREFQERGKTIVYVSHDLESIRNFCQEAIILDYSQLIAHGKTGEIVNRYITLIDEREKIHFSTAPDEFQPLPAEKDYRTYFDFYREFDRAEKNAPYLDTNPELLARTQFPSARGSLPAILAHPASEIAYRVEVREGTTLTAGVALLPECWDKPGKGVVFAIYILVEGQRRLLLEDRLDPQNNPAHRKLNSHRLSLENYAGKKVTIILTTAGLTSDLNYAWACWIQPRLSIPAARPEGEAHPGEAGFATYSRYGRREAEIVKIEIFNARGQPTTHFQAGEEMIIKFHVYFNSDVEKFVIGNIFRNKWGLNVYGMNTEWFGLPDEDYHQGDRLAITFRHKVSLADGTYSLNPATSSCVGKYLYHTLDWIDNAAIIRVSNPRRMEGYVSLPTEIKIEKIR